MHLLVHPVSIILTVLLSGLNANITTGDNEVVNTEPLLLQTELPKGSSENNTATTPKQEYVTHSTTTDSSTTNSKIWSSTESVITSPTTPLVTEKNKSITEFAKEDTVTKTLTSEDTVTKILISEDTVTKVLTSEDTVTKILTSDTTSSVPTTTTLESTSQPSTSTPSVQSQPATSTVSVKSKTTTTTASVISQPSWKISPTTDSFLKEYATTTPVSTGPVDSTIQISTTTLSHSAVIKSETSTEHNNVIIPTEDESASSKGMDIVVGHKCYKIFQDSTMWNDTDGGMLALKSCPVGYQGNMYRPCFSSGKWGNVDYSECRLEHLGRMRHMIAHQVEKGMLGNMYVLAEEFSKYISSVDMKSPMDRLEAFEILNTFLKVDMNLKMDKSRDKKYIQTLLHSCNELIKKKTVLFSPGSQENKLISEKAVEMVFDLTYFAERSLRGLLKTQKKQIAFRSSPNVVLYLYRGKLSGKFTLTNFTSEYERDDEISSIFNLENTLERSAYALIWIKGLRRLLSTKDLVVNSDVAVATILSPLNSLNRMAHPPTFDIGLRMEKAEVEGYTLKCGQLWNMSKLWNTKDCTKANVKGDIVTCRCHHLGSIALLLEEDSQGDILPSVSPIGKLISCSCIISLFATVLTLITYYFLLHREEQHLSIFIFVNMITCLLAVQLMLLYGVNKGGQKEVCMSFAIMLHYLFMVLCCWVVAYGVNLLRRLRTNMEYNGRPRDYCAACWLTPGIMLTIAFMLNPDGYETQLYCWMNIERGILWSFVFPVTALILVNTVVMILALKTFNEQMSVTHRTEICKTRNSLRAGLTLLPFFAVNWFFGILAVEDSFNLLLQLIFCITNAMQGILTFIFFCLMDANIVAFFRLKITVVTRKPRVSSMKLTKSGSFPILDRSLIALATDDRRRLDRTPLLATPPHDDPCCSNIRV